LRTIIKTKIGSLLGFLIRSLVPGKATMSEDPLEAYMALEAP
jgi:hypothetical protein